MRQMMTWFAYQAKVMKELIKENSFIVIGRGGDYVLKDYPYLVRVFVHSQYKDCLAHEMEIMQCSEKDAAERIAKTNKYRSDYYKHFTGREWWDEEIMILFWIQAATPISSVQR